MEARSCPQLQLHASCQYQIETTTGLCPLFEENADRIGQTKRHHLKLRNHHFAQQFEQLQNKIVKKC